MSHNLEQSANSGRQQRNFGEMHPAVYLCIVGLAVWLVAAAWGFGISAQTDYLLAVVTGFFAMAIGLPWLLWMAGRRRNDRETDRQSRDSDHQTKRPVPVRDWLSGEVEIGQGRLRGAEVALQILLPIAALAIGMTAFAIVMNVEI